jgi:hypothetical protein
LSSYLETGCLCCARHDGSCERRCEGVRVMSQSSFRIPPLSAHVQCLAPRDWYDEIHRHRAIQWALMHRSLRLPYQCCIVCAYQGSITKLILATLRSARLEPIHCYDYHKGVFKSKFTIRLHEDLTLYRGIGIGVLEMSGTRD